MSSNCNNPFLDCFINLIYEGINMNKLLVTGAIMAVMGFSSQAVSTEAQIDALQNEILK